MTIPGRSAPPRILPAVLTPADLAAVEARDRAWIKAVRDGDPLAFSALFRAYHGPLCTFAYRIIRGTDAAEDLVQEVFLYVWESRATLSIDGSVRAYLFSATHNAAISYLRHAQVVERSTGAIVSLFDRPVATPDMVFGAREARRSLQAAIARLPDRCRLVFTLQREQGMSYAEIAAVLGISVKTVDAQMGRAVKHLRQWLGPDWP